MCIYFINKSSDLIFFPFLHFSEELSDPAGTDDSSDYLDAFYSNLLLEDMGSFDEDKYLLEAMQGQIEDDPRGMDYLEVTLGADGAGMFVRQILNKKLKAEGRTLSGGRS